MNASQLWRAAKRLLSGRFVRDAMQVGGGAVVGQLITLLAIPLLTRLYTPEEFGTLAVYASIVFIAFSVAALRYEIAIPLPGKSAVAAGLVVASLICVAAVGAALAVVVYFGGDEIVEILNAPGLRAYLWLVPVGVAGGGFYRVLNHWAIRKKAFKAIARTKISQNVSMVFTQVGLGVAGAGPVGLIVGDVIGRAGGSGTLLALVLRQDTRLFRALKLRRIAAAARRYVRFPLYSSGSALFNSAGLQVPALLVAAVYGVQAAGFFSLSQRVVSTPSWLVSQAVNQVYFGEAAEMARERPEHLYRLYLQLSKYLMLLGAVIAVGLATLSPLLFPIVFGGEWTEAGVYAQFLALAFLGQFVVAPVSLTLSVLERQRLQLAWDAGRFALIVAVFEACRRAEATSEVAVLSYSAVLLATYIVLWLLSLAAVKKRIGVAR